MKFTDLFKAARIAFLIGFGVFLLGGLLWRLGLLQDSELWVYDYFVVWHSNPKTEDPRFVLILQDENDVRRSRLSAE